MIKEILKKTFYWVSIVGAIIGCLAILFFIFGNTKVVLPMFGISILSELVASLILAWWADIEKKEGER